MLLKKCLPFVEEKFQAKRCFPTMLKKIYLVLFVLLIRVLKNIDRPANLKPK
jgi:hypothetical protein